MFYKEPISLINLIFLSRHGYWTWQRLLPLNDLKLLGMSMGFLWECRHCVTSMALIGSSRGSVFHCFLSLDLRLSGSCPIYFSNFWWYLLRAGSKSFGVLASHHFQSFIWHNPAPITSSEPRDWKQPRLTRRRRRKMDRLKRELTALLRRTNDLQHRRKIVLWMQKTGLLAGQMTCPECTNPMRLVETSRHDGFQWWVEYLWTWVHYLPLCNG